MSAWTYFVVRDGVIIDFITDDRDEAERVCKYNRRNYMGGFKVVAKRKKEADALLRENDAIITDPVRGPAIGSLTRR